MSFDNIKLEKGLYTTGKSFTKALEEIDPSENYVGTPLEGLDAYQRQLKRFDIKVSGNNSDTISKFFSTTDSAALFPEYVSRAVRQGLDENNAVDKIVAATTVIDSLDYRAIESVADDDFIAADIAEGAVIPQTTIKVKETLTPLRKQGRMLVASYEAIKHQKLDLFTVALKQIGSYIANMQLDYAIDTIYKSDCETLSSSELDYSALVSLWNSFSPYNLTSILATPNTVADILNLPEFKDATAGFNFMSTGSLVTPFGAEIIKTDKIGTDSFIVGLDKNYALEKVQAGDITVDFDKLIDRQLERASITSITGFSRIFDDASKLLTLG